MNLLSIDFNVDRLLTKLEALATEHGAEAVNTAATIVQVDGIINLLWGGFFFCLLLTCILFGTFCIKKTTANPEDDWSAGIAISILVGLFSYILCGVFWLNVWNWIALFNPKLALAHEIWVKLGS